MERKCYLQIGSCYSPSREYLKKIHCNPMMFKLEKYFSKRNICVNSSLLNDSSKTITKKESLLRKLKIGKTESGRIKTTKFPKLCGLNDYKSTGISFYNLKLSKYGTKQNHQARNVSSRNYNQIMKKTTIQNFNFFGLNENRSANTSKMMMLSTEILNKSDNSDLNPSPKRKIVLSKKKLDLIQKDFNGSADFREKSESPKFKDASI